MTPRLLNSKRLLTTACASLWSAASLWAGEPLAAPPAAPLVQPPISVVAPLAPAPTDISGGGALSGGGPELLPPSPVDATYDSSVVPAARRDGAYYGNPYGGRIGGEPISAPGSYYGTTGLPASELPNTTMNLDEATVRITDRPAEEIGDCPPGVRVSNRICPHCRYSPNGIPYHLDPQYDPPAQMMNRYRRRHGITFSPDYGWSPPGKYPIDRVSIDYYRAFPGAWTGQPSGPAVVRPSVYWPTDTTQLGYTYQQTPRWMPYPNMVPPVPHPGQWHLPLCGAYGGGPGRYCPECRQGESWIPSDVETTPPTPESAPTYNPAAVTQQPTGPALNTANAPQLTPVPF